MNVCEWGGLSESVCSRLQVGLRPLQPARGRRPEQVFEVPLRPPRNEKSVTEPVNSHPEPRHNLRSFW